MTVRELVDVLQALVASGDTTPEAHVITEGCDCYSDADKVEVSDVDHASGDRRPVVVITRVS